MDDKVFFPFPSNFFFKHLQWISLQYIFRISSREACSYDVWLDGVQQFSLLPKFVVHLRVSAQYMFITYFLILHHYVELENTKTHISKPERYIYIG